MSGTDYSGLAAALEAVAGSASDLTEGERKACWRAAAALEEIAWLETKMRGRPAYFVDVDGAGSLSEAIQKARQQEASGE